MIKLKHFTPEEFVRNGIDFWPMMDIDYLLLLDELREKSGYRLSISKHRHALGRVESGSKTSQHYLRKIHVKQAIPRLKVADLMPMANGVNGWRGLMKVEMENLVNTARDLGFNGIGIYPLWKPVPGIHLDQRSGPVGGASATWAGVPMKKNYEGKTIIQQAYVSMTDGFDRFPTGGEQ